MNHEFSDYRLMCDAGMHFVLFVQEKKQETTFIVKEKKKVDVEKMSTEKFNDLYTLEHPEYSLVDFANRTLGLQKYGVLITPRARLYLTAILENKEFFMAKPTAPVSTKAAPLPEPKKAVPTPRNAPAEPKAAKEPKAEGDEGSRVRREKLDSGLKIKVIGQNTARVGTVRHAIVENILKARTVAEALDTEVPRKDGTAYKIGTPDLYFALDNKLIELY